MTQPINLNHVRKAKARDQKAKKADENRVKFGRKKSEANAIKADAGKLARKIDDHKRER